MPDVIETNHIYTYLENTDKSVKSKKIFALEGSSGSGKTWGAIDFILDWNRKHSFENKLITIARQTYRDCSTTVMYDFIKRLKMIGWYNQKNHSQSHPQKYFLFGNQIDFIGLADNGQPSKRQDITWFNEGLETQLQTYQQYNQRTNDIFMMDWNPSCTEHWIFNNVLTRPDCYYKHSTYKQNRFLPEGQRQELDAYEPTAENIKNGTADDFMYQVYSLGLRASAKGLIFQHVNWIDKFPDDVHYQYGLDFGFTNDPTALVKCATKGKDDYYELLLYEPIDNAITLSDYMEKIGISKKRFITAESSDRYNDNNMVMDLRDLGWNINKVNKGKGLNWRLGIMKKNHINIVRNTNFKREQENYKWREVGGILLNEPIDKFNHAWDAAGYGKIGLMANEKITIKSN